MVDEIMLDNTPALNNDVIIVIVEAATTIIPGFLAIDFLALASLALVSNKNKRNIIFRENEYINIFKGMNK